MIKRLKWALLAILALSCAFFSYLSYSRTAGARPLGSILVDIEAPLISPAQAHNVFEHASRLSTGKPIFGIQQIGQSEAEISSEILELARGLKYDPVLIYKYVRNHIDYVPVYGAVKDALSTYYTKQGNDFDQVSLFIALMRASGYTANYVYGTVTYPGSEVANWLGVMNQESALSDILGSAAIPGSINTSTDGTVISVTIDHVWAKVNINGTDYFFDPSFKQYATSPKLDLAEIIGYNKEAFLAAVKEGATVDSNFTQNLNSTNLKDMLVSYSMNLNTYLKTYLPNGSIDDVLGKREIVPDQNMPMQTSIPYPHTILDEWSEIPDAYRHHLRVQHQGIDHTFATFEIYGRRVSISYNSYAPELRVDGELIGVGSNCIFGNLYDLTVTIDHPYPANAGTYGDEAFSRKIEAGRQYIITADIGGIARSIITHRKRVLHKNISKGLPYNSESVLCEALHLMGLLYLAQCDRAAKLAARVGDSVVICHHYIGLVGEIDSPFIDMRSGFHSVISIKNDHVSERACVYAMGGIWSALEHAMITQSQKIDAVSTIRLFWIANAQGDKIFNAEGSNWSSIKAQLRGYSSDVLGEIENLIASGQVFILPQNGSLSLNQWTGAAYIQHNPSNGATVYWIWGWLAGGNGTIIKNIDPESTLNTCYDMCDNGDSQLQNPQSDEPVDMANGSYLYEHTDLSIGRDDNPLALNMRSYYNSRYRYPWTHSYMIFIRKGSDAFQILGDGLHVNAVGALAELVVTIDLWRYPQTHGDRVIATLAHNVLAEMLIENQATLNLEGKKFEFIRLPDRSYTPPPGITDELIEKGDNSYTLKRHFGTVLEFNSQGWIESWADANGNLMEFGYDQTGKLISVTDAFGRSLVFSRGDNTFIATDFIGRSVRYDFNAEGNITAITDPMGNTRHFIYDEEQRLIEIRFPSGHKLVTNTYDSSDRVIKQENGRGYEYEFLWSEVRNIERDPLGNERTYQFDKNGRLICFIDKASAARQYTYDGQNRITSITDPRGNITRFGYDEIGNLISITSPLGHITSFTYDTFNRLTSIIDPSGNQWRYTYDEHNNLTSILDPLGNSISYTYDPKGRKTSFTDANGNTTSFSYDNNNCLSSFTDSLGNLTVFTCDAVGNRTSVTDPNGNITFFAYDANRKVKGVSEPYGTVSYTYDDNGNLATRTDQNGNTTQYDYDGNFNLLKITYPTYTVQFGYDELDNLNQVVDPVGVSTYNYDEEGRLISYTDKNGYSVNYSYDVLGNSSSITYPGNKAVTYNYDQENLLKKVIDWLGGQTNYSDYDERRLLRLVTLPNGTRIQYDYDEAGRIKSIKNLDLANNIIASYRYELKPNGDILFEEINQPLLPSFSSADINYTYGPDNRIVSANGTDFQYDNNGNLIQKGNINYQYDYENRLVKVNTISDTWEYIYDGLGNRICMKHNDEVHWYLLDPRGISRVLAEYDDHGIIAHYVYGKCLISIIGPSNNPHYYHYNFTGNTVAITDPNGNIVNRYAYTPYGKLAGMEEAISNPFKYVGKFGVMDDGNGLLFMRARYYDPEIGRFVSKDPFLFVGGINLYEYAGSNPVNRVDPFGLCIGNDVNWAFILWEGLTTLIDLIQGTYVLPGADEIWEYGVYKSWGAASRETRKATQIIHGYLREYEQWNKSNQRMINDLMRPLNMSNILR